MTPIWSALPLSWKLSYRDAGVSPQKYNALAKRHNSQRAVNKELRDSGITLYAPSDNGWRPAAGPMGAAGWRSKQYRSFAGVFRAAQNLPYHTLSYLAAYGYATSTSPKDTDAALQQWRSISDSAGPDDYNSYARDRIQAELDDYFVVRPGLYALWVKDA